jgi:hypothetical protein
LVKTVERKWGIESIQNIEMADATRNLNTVQFQGPWGIMQRKIDGPGKIDHLLLGVLVLYFNLLA